jgi:metallo-beta-lactamase class B
MRTRLFLLWLSLTLSVHVAATAGDAPSPCPDEPAELAPGLIVRGIGRGAYVVTHSIPVPCNALLVEMPDGTLVLAGSTWSADATQQLLDWAHAKWGDRPIVAINTGYHVDNLGGNHALQLAGIPVYGSELTARLLTEHGDRQRALLLRMLGGEAAPDYAIHEANAYEPPTHLFALAEGLTLRFGGEEVRVIFPGHTQASDKVVVYFPSRRLLFGGCAVVGGPRLGNLAEADLQAWRRAIRRLAELPCDIVVPGHSPRLDAGVLQHTQRLLTDALSVPLPPQE